VNAARAGRPLRALVVLSGAGLSADSGLPTFRGAGGLWEGRRVEDVATPQAWARDPAAVWRFYQLRRAALVGAQPNAAHQALARLQRELAARRVPLLLATQNVDDLLERAGAQALHVHGSLAHLRCERCGLVVHDLARLAPGAFVPCAGCAHARLRPDVVWFGELPVGLDACERAIDAASHFVAIGTSGQVWPVAGFLELARRRGAATIVQALEPPENLAPGDVFRGGRAAEVVPGIVEELLALSP
jgi:NAD-dependent deacetylase